MYLSSSIEKNKSGLFYVEIKTSWFYFGEQTEHTTVSTLSEAKAWLLMKRCSNLKIDEGEKGVVLQDKKEIAEPVQFGPEEEEVKEIKKESLKSQLKESNKNRRKAWAAKYSPAGLH